MELDRTTRRVRTLSVSDLQELSQLQHRTSSTLEKLINTAFRAGVRAPVQWWKAQESLVERLCRYLCDVAVSLHHARGEELLRIEKVLRDHAASQRGKVSFGHNVAFLRALRGAGLGSETGSLVPELDQALRQPVPPQLREFVLWFKLLKDAGSFGVPGARLGAYIEKHRKGSSAGKPGLIDVFNAYTELRNAFHHASEDDGDDGEAKAADHNWWSNQPAFVAHVAAESAWALRHLLCWGPVRALVAELEVVELTSADGRLRRRWPSREPLGQDDRFRLTGTLPDHWKPGQLVLSRRVPAEVYTLRVVCAWTRYPECRRPADSVVDDLIRRYATDLVAKGHVAAQEREEIEKDAESQGVKKAFTAGLRSLSESIAAVLQAESDDDEASGEPPTDMPEQAPDRPAQDSPPPTPEAEPVTDTELVSVLMHQRRSEPKDAPPAGRPRHRAALLQRLGGQLQREFKDEGMTTADIVARYGGYSSEVGKLLLEALASDPLSPVERVDRDLSGDRQDVRYAIVDHELRAQMRQAVGKLRGLKGLPDDAAEALVGFATVASRLFSLSITSGDSFEGDVRLFRERTLSTTAEPGGDEAESIWLQVGDRRIAAPSQVGLVQELGRALGPSRVDELPDRYALSPVDVFFGQEPRHSTDQKMELAVEWAGADGAVRHVEANWPRAVLLFHLSVLLEALDPQEGSPEDWALRCDPEEVSPSLAEAIRQRACELREGFAPAAPLATVESLEGVGGIEVRFASQGDDPESSDDEDERDIVHIVGKTVPVFIQNLLEFIVEQLWLERRLCAKADPLVLPLVAGRTKVALSHTPIHLNGRAMERYATRRGYYLDASLTWKGAIERAIWLLRDQLDVRSTSQDRPVAEVVSLGPPTRQAIRLDANDGIEGLPKEGIEGSTVKDFVAAVLAFIEESDQHQLPPLPVVFRRRVFISDTPHHPGKPGGGPGKDFRAPLAVEHCGATIHVECHLSVRSARIRCRNLLRLSEKASGARWWLIAPGQEAALWEQWLEYGVATLEGWSEVGDLSDFESRDEVEKRIMELQPDRKSRPSNDALALWQFGNVVKPGDVMLAKRGRSAVLGWGIVKGDYALAPSTGEHSVQQLAVDWHVAPVEELGERQLVSKTLTDVSDSDLLDLLPWTDEVEAALLTPPETPPQADLSSEATTGAS